MLGMKGSIPYEKIKNTITETIVVILSLIVLLPLYLMLINSFKTSAGAAELGLSFPNDWRILENYRDVVISSNLLRAFKNSAIVTSISVVATVLFASSTAFILQRKKNKASNAIFNIIVLGLIIPGSIVPTYFIAHFLHLDKNYLGVCLVYIACMFPVTVFLYYGYFKTIPYEIDESAIIDGSGLFRMFFSIIFPIVTPITITATILIFMNVWNDFQVAIYFLSSAQKQTMVLTTYYFFGQKKADWNLVFADVILVSLPVVILYFTLQKYIVSGLSAGALKG